MFKNRIPTNIEHKKNEMALERQPSTYKEIAHLEEHQDGVRDVCFLTDKNYLVTVSEDSTMKIWNTEKAKDKIDCLATVREHAGPVFTAVEGDGHLFTGGMEGVIRCWNFPRQINMGQSHKNFLNSSWNNSEDQKL